MSVGDGCSIGIRQLGGQGVGGLVVGGKSRKV